MLFRTADQAFAVFQRTGEPRALARVFDRTAPELLRLARHLASGEAAAEDLVQATFVTAIEAAKTHRTGEPVMPWLAGILANHARAARRKERRALDAARAARDDTTDPVYETARRELHGRLGEAIDALPEPYRPVLRLLLEQGLTPAEIARALERPQGTVRAQVHRGIELLRAALPAALGAGAALAATPGRGLGAVRAEVLARCGAHAGGAAAGITVLSTLALMHWKWLVPAAALVAAAFSFSALLGDSPSADVAGTPPPGATLVARDAPGETEASSTGADAVAGRRPIAAAPRVAAPPPTAAVRVRVLRAADRTPLADVPVQLAPLALLHDPEGWSEPRRTDDHGVAKFTEVEPGALRALVEHADASAFVSAAADECADVDILVPAGITVEGTVRDTVGHPVPGATILVHGNRTEPAALATSDRQGRYRVAHIADRAALQARAPGHAPSLGHRVAGRDGATVTLDLVLQGRGRRLVGQVRAPDGSPAASVRVALVPPHRLPVPSQAPFPFAAIVRTDADGRFATDDASSGALTVVALPPRGSDLVPGTATVAEGSEDAAVDLALGRGAAVHGVVHGVDHARGQVYVQAFCEHAAAALGYLGNLHGMRTATVGADGAFRVRGLAPGAVQLTVIRQQMLARATLTLREGEDVAWNPDCGGDATLAVAVDPPAPPKGVGFAWLVNLYRRGADGSLEYRNSAAPDGKGRIAFTGVEPGVSHDVVVLLPRGRGAFDHLVLAHVRDVQPRAEPHRIGIPPEALPSSGLRGRLTDAHGAPHANQELVARAQAGEVMVSHASTVTGADGSFDFGSLPPGTWTLLLGKPPDATVLGNHDLTAARPLDLGDVVVP